LAGIGTVGGNLLEQIKLQQKTLTEHNGLKIKIVGIADVDNMILDRRGINLDTYMQE
jgi:aspartokinase/homoserine dehydrogenase 1